MGTSKTRSGQVQSYMRVIVIACVLLALLVFFYCLLCQYDTYGEPGYTYHVSYEEWMQMIAQAQEMKDNWIVDNVTGINLAVSLAMGILFVVFVRVTKENRIQLRGVKQTVIGASIVYAGSLLLIRLTADQFRLYMNFTAAEVIALAILVFLFANGILSIRRGNGCAMGSYSAIYQCKEKI